MVKFCLRMNTMFNVDFVCVEVLRPSAVSLPNHTFTGQA